VIAVLGGGITGLAAAYELARLAVPFTLVEAAERLGGLIHTERTGGFVLDAGPDSLLVQKPAAIALCDELGLGPRLVPTTPPRTAYVLKQGRLHALPSPSVLGLPTTREAVMRYDLLGWPARLRLLCEPLVPRRSRSDESVGAFFRRRFGGDTVALIAEPLLGGIHAGDIEALSIASLFPRLVEAERRPGGVLRNLAVATVSPRDGLFRALRSGMGELVDAIASALPPHTVLTGARAEAVERAGGTWRVRADRRTIEARAVILALPAHTAARLMAPIDRTASDLLAAVPYVSTASVALAWRRADVAHPLAGSGFVVARRYNRLRITACTWVSSKWADRAPRDHVLLRAFLGGAHDPGVMDLSDTDLAAAATGDISSTLGITASPTLVRVFRAPHAGAQHVVGHRARTAALAARLAGHPGLFAAGSGIAAIGIPDCVADGRQAAMRAVDYVRMSGHDSKGAAF
jgi:protoporphyrinogen/coproporphyrinogen III oxidase